MTRLPSTRRRQALLAALVALPIAGCAMVLGFENTTLRPSGDGGQLLDGDLREDGGTDAGPASRLTAEPSAIVVRRGATVSVKVTLDRGSDVKGALTAKLEKLPPGVTATAGTIAEGATTTTIDVKASADAPFGSSTIDLTLDPPALPGTPLSLLVAGAAGAIDTSFDGDGFIADATRGAAGTFYTLALQADGKIVAAGSGNAGPGNQTAWFVKRFNADATPDTTFTNNAAASVPTTGEAHAVAIDGQGRIVLCGTTGNGAGQLTVVRLDPEGKIDPLFATGTVRLAAQDAPLGSQGAGIAVAPNGDVVAVGTRAELVDSTGVIVRYKTDGTRDTTFNGGVIVALQKARLFGVVIDKENAIYAGGTNNTGNATLYTLAKRLATGAPDPAFGGGSGTLTYAAGYRGRAVARLADGTLFLAGDSLQPPNQYTGGLLSPTGGQIFLRAFGTAAGASFYAIATDAEKRILLAGHGGPPNGEARIDRVLVDGGRDPEFGVQGSAILEPGGLANGFDLTLHALAIQGDGRILVSGNKTNAGAVIYRLWP